VSAGGGICLVAGLGNPGAKYQNNRHNAGFWFLDYLARRHHAQFKEQAKFKSSLCTITLCNQPIKLVKPNAFMNRSGWALSAVVHFYQLDIQRVLVVHDEIDFPSAKLRLKYGGGHGGHNGLLDIIRHLGKDFWRLRIGIGHPGAKDQVVSYVLADAQADERNTIEAHFAQLSELVEAMVIGEFQKAMEALHSEAREARPRASHVGESWE